MVYYIIILRGRWNLAYTTMCIMYNFIYLHGADINNKRLKGPGGQ